MLILGSLPGEASLKAGRYYAHPQNAFWRLLGGAIDCDLAGMEYPVRLDSLLNNGIGLWDVVASAERRGSLDTAIRKVEQADLDGLIATLPSLRAIAFNGKTAARLGRRALANHNGLSLIDLPSSSAAFTLSPTLKARSWAVLGDVLTQGPHA